jgi:hypothetical protein
MDFFDVFSLIAINVAFYYGFVYLICWRYFLRPMLHSIGWKGKPPKPTHHLEGNGSFDFPIVGEASYQKNLALIAGQKQPNGVEIKTKAIVFLDPFNRHDKNAVRVEINGLIVGHLSKDNALQNRAWLKINKLGSITCLVDAVITGGWLRSDSEGYFGVSLDFTMNKFPYILR